MRYHKAHQQVHRAVKAGLLKNLREEFVLCVDCKKKRAWCYDHRDYDNPLDVEPVCYACNVKRGEGSNRDNTFFDRPKLTGLRLKAMPTPKSMLGIKGDECQCGRRKSIIHCPECGSSRHYSRKNRYHKMMNGELKLVPTELVCMNCGHEYLKEETEWCNAPPVGAVLAAQRVRATVEAKASGQHLTASERRIADAAEKVAPSEINSITSETKRDQIAKIRVQLRTAYSDELRELKMLNGIDAHLNETVDQYIARNLLELTSEQLKAFGLTAEDIKEDIG